MFPDFYPFWFSMPAPKLDLLCKGIIFLPIPTVDSNILIAARSLWNLVLGISPTASSVCILAGGNDHSQDHNRPSQICRVKLVRSGLSCQVFRTHHNCMPACLPLNFLPSKHVQPIVRLALLTSCNLGNYKYLCVSSSLANGIVQKYETRLFSIMSIPLSKILSYISKDCHDLNSTSCVVGCDMKMTCIQHP